VGYDRQMNLRDVTITDIPLFRAWFTNDEAGLRFVGDYQDVKQILELVGEHRRFWLVYEEDTPVGFLDLEVDGTRGYSSLYVAPTFRQKGYSVKLHAILAEQAKKLGVTELFGHVEQDNEASIKALEKAGYKRSAHLDKDDFLIFSLKISK
jgi:RimJ/RimL family protein N-acetyltransferase